MRSRLAEARTRTFARRKIFIVSTPTIAGASAIEREYEASDQRRYFVPCPHCDHRQWLRFEQLRWEKGQPDTAAYVCESCEAPIAEHHKTGMLEHGEWRAMAPENGSRDRRLSPVVAVQPGGLAQLARHCRGLGERGEPGIRIRGGDQDLQEHRTRRDLGRGRRSAGLATPARAARGLPHRQRAAGGLLLVGGADVQKDRIEASIWAFGRGKESWLIEHRVLMGDTARDAVWKRLGEMLAETWTHASGAPLPLARFALDTGFATQEAYAFVRAMSRSPGHGGQGRGPRCGADRHADGGRCLRRVASGCAAASRCSRWRSASPSWSSTTTCARAAEVAEDGVTVIYPAGFVHLPKIDGEFIQQLCAEQLVTRRDRNGFAHARVAKDARAERGFGLLHYARAAAARPGSTASKNATGANWNDNWGSSAPAETPPQPLNINEATDSGGLAVSTHRNAGRRVIKSRWLTR